MFSWWHRKSALGGELIGDLDLMSRRPVFIRYNGKEWRVKDLTAREYARLCAIIKQIESETSKGENPDAVDALYTEVLMLCMPSLGRWRIKRMSMIDMSAMVIWIIKHYGGDLEKKKTVESKPKA